VSYTVACVVGARPNFVKIGPILEAFAAQGSAVKPLLIHTGQHYDEEMNDLFFRQLGLPKPDINLEVGSGRQGEQTARILDRYEQWLLTAQPAPCATLVVGDVNSTVACSLASVKLGIPVVHVEAGLRSFDRSMPEEINRILTDAISDLLLVSEATGVDNLLREGRPPTSIRLVGNVMVDSLQKHRAIALQLDTLNAMGVRKGEFILWTMHRPSNVDQMSTLGPLIACMVRIAASIPIVFPVHPRTEARLKSFGLWARLEAAEGIKLASPLGYLEFLNLSSQSKIIVTDSGGLQEEATALAVPCLTLRTNTERPITVSEGTSTLVANDTVLLESLVQKIRNEGHQGGRIPKLWDGKAGERVCAEVVRFLEELPAKT